VTLKDEVLGLARQQWSTLQRQFQVRRLGLFGSCVRNEARAGSDVDLLVEFDSTTFDNYMGLKLFLEGRLHRKVDLVIEESVKPRLRPYILREVEYV